MEWLESFKTIKRSWNQE